MKATRRKEQECNHLPANEGLMRKLSAVSIDEAPEPRLYRNKRIPWDEDGLKPL